MSELGEETITKMATKPNTGNDFEDLLLGAKLGEKIMQNVILALLVDKLKGAADISNKPKVAADISKIDLKCRQKLLEIADELKTEYELAKEYDKTLKEYLETIQGIREVKFGLSSNNNLKELKTHLEELQVKVEEKVEEEIFIYKNADRLIVQAYILLFGKSFSLDQSEPQDQSELQIIYQASNKSAGINHAPINTALFKLAELLPRSAFFSFYHNPELDLKDTIEVEAQNMLLKFQEQEEKRQNIANRGNVVNIVNMANMTKEKADYVTARRRENDIKKLLRPKRSIPLINLNIVSEIFKIKQGLIRDTEQAIKNMVNKP
ncbi:MAG: hypothetical protein QXS17_00945 [Candidatus Micrarchaeaceae archaeon]